MVKAQRSMKMEINILDIMLLENKMDKECTNGRMEVCMLGNSRKE
jgi:hypothetical protein